MNQYSGIEIKADPRIHTAVFKAFAELHDRRELGTRCLDIASGHGAFSQRLIDEYPSLVVDCNDLLSHNYCRGFNRSFSVDLNDDFSFGGKYEWIFAIEVLEHLENPSRFMRNVVEHLDGNGTLIVTTPCIGSLVDRIWFLVSGYNYYFGERGIKNSGGHISPISSWQMNNIAQALDLTVEMLVHDIDYKDLGWRFRLLLSFLKPLRSLWNLPQNNSIDIYIIRKRARDL